MPVTILAPLNGDTVIRVGGNAPVQVDYDFADTVTRDVDCSLDNNTQSGIDPTAQLTGPNLQLHEGGIPIAPGQGYTLTVTANNQGGSDSQQNITVSDVTPPIEAEDPFLRDKERKQFMVQGTCNPILKPAAVVCVAFRVKKKKFKVVDVAQSEPNQNGKWSAQLTIQCGNDAAHVIRCFVFGEKGVLLGSTTKLVKGCR